MDSTELTKRKDPVIHEERSLYKEIQNELFDGVHPGVFVKARQMRITSNATIPVWAY